MLRPASGTLLSTICPAHYATAFKRMLREDWPHLFSWNAYTPPEIEGLSLSREYGVGHLQFNGGLAMAFPEAFEAIPGVRHFGAHFSTTIDCLPDVAATAQALLSEHLTSRLMRLERVGDAGRAKEALDRIADPFVRKAFRVDRAWIEVSQSSHRNPELSSENIRRLGWRAGSQGGAMRFFTQIEKRPREAPVEVRIKRMAQALSGN